MKTLSTIHMKIFTALMLLVLGVVLLPQSAAAQVDDDFERMKKEFEQFQDKVHDQFISFKDSIDQEFAEYMRNSWKAFKTFEGDPVPVDPFQKPKAQPQFDPNNHDGQGGAISGKVTKPVPAPTNPQDNIEDNFEPLDLPEDQVTKGNRKLQALAFDFYGVELPLRYDPAMTFVLRAPYNSGIPDAWERIARSDYYAIVNQFGMVAERMQLNDWGYYTLVRKFAHRLFPDDYNSQVLFSCFVLNKSGYIAKIGFSNDDLYLLLSSEQEIFEKPYLHIESKRYYAFSFNPNRKAGNPSLTTYEGDYHRTDRQISFAYKRRMNFPKDLKEKELSFSFDGISYRIPVTYNQALVDFYQEMPLVGFEVTLGAPLSEDCLRSLRKGLMPLMRGKSEREQANILLRFVQKAFPYQTDQQQFGTEKYFYPEELFYFPYSDCEDRSALYSTLVRELMGLDVMGVIFPQHVATAVRFKTFSDGDHLTYNRDKYLICDPTYIGADVGQCMEKLRNAPAQLIVLK